MVCTNCTYRVRSPSDFGGDVGVRRDGVRSFTERRGRRMDSVGAALLIAVALIVFVVFHRS